MKVFNDNGTIINVEEGCPSIPGLIARNAEELPISLFCELANFADNTNTHKTDGSWTFDFDVDAYIGTLKKQVSALVQQEKSRIKNGGFLVGETLFDSDDPAQIAVTQLTMKMMNNPSYVVPNWKASAGVWVTMNAALLAEVTTQWEAHCQACFNWQVAKEGEISACSTVAELKTISTVFEEQA